MSVFFNWKNKNIWLFSIKLKVTSWPLIIDNIQYNYNGPIDNKFTLIMLDYINKLRLTK